MSPKELKYYEFVVTEDEDLSSSDEDNARPLLARSRASSSSLSTKQTEATSTTYNTTTTPTSAAAAASKPVMYDFLIFFVIALYVTTAIEAQAGLNHPAPPVGHDTPPILDMGFSWTQPLYEFLKAHRHVNDVLAFINSCALLLPLAYSFYITVFRKDYSLIFAIVACQCLRSACGYITHLPPSPDYLPSHYDYPDVLRCWFTAEEGECEGEPTVMPFISFYSGHVTNLVLAGNDLWMRQWFGSSLLLHALNVFQIVRMLATRGHYTIDIVAGWLVAVYVSGYFAKLGRDYNTGKTLAQVLLPASWAEAFDTFTGLSVVKHQMQSQLQQTQETKEVSSVVKIKRTSLPARGGTKQQAAAPKFERSPSLAYSTVSSTSSSSSS